MPRQTWIAQRAREFGLEVVEADGWLARGSASFTPKGVVCHHTAGPAAGDMPSLRILVNGRQGVPGPLCNVGLARSGTVYVVAAGRANHAGTGEWKNLVGNSTVLGIEAENTGRGEPWPTAQFDAYVALAAALTSGIGADPGMVCAHREWTTRKIDPQAIEMDDFRARVGHRLDGPQPEPQASGVEGRVRQLQTLVGTTADGDFGPKTEAACRAQLVGWRTYVQQHAPRLADDLHGNNNTPLVRWLQEQGNRRFNLGLVVDGQVGPATNHLIVQCLGQADGVCGPAGFRGAVQ